MFKSPRAALASAVVFLAACSSHNRSNDPAPAAPPETELKTLGYFEASYDGERFAITPLDANGNPAGKPQFGPSDTDPTTQQLTLETLTSRAENSTTGTGDADASAVLVKQTAPRALDTDCNNVAVIEGDTLAGGFQGLCAPIEIRNGYTADEIIRVHVENTSISNTVGVVTLMINAGSDSAFGTSGTYGVWNHGRVAEETVTDGVNRLDWGRRVWYFANTVPGMMARFSTKFVVKGEVVKAIRRADASFSGSTCVPVTTYAPSVSANGDYIVYASSSIGCRAAGALIQVYRYQVSTGTNTLVSHAAGATTTFANGNHTKPTVSSDGRYVAWLSTNNPGLANPLVTGGIDVTGAYQDVNAGTADVYVRDMTSAGHDTWIASVNDDVATTVVGAVSDNPVISPNGTHVVFQNSGVLSYTGAADEDLNDDVDVYLRQFDGGLTELVSPGAVGRTAGATNPGVSNNADGVVYTSADNTIVAGDGGQIDVFLRCFAPTCGALGTRRISSDSGGGTADADSGAGAISASGAVVAFESPATDILAGATGATHIYVRRANGTGNVVRADFAPDLVTEANASASRPSLSTDGRIVTFVSLATNLDALDGNGNADVFMYDVHPNLFAAGTQDVKRRRNFLISSSRENAVSDSGVNAVGVTTSSNGNYAAFISNSANLTAGGPAANRVYVAPLR